MNNLYSTAYHQKDLGKWNFLVTGGAGFIGANIVEYLLKYDAKKVRVLDNLSTGYETNLKEFRSSPKFEFMRGDIRNLDDCKKAMKGMDYISHQVALGSVPRSIHDPITTNDVNINGFLNMLCAMKDDGQVKRMVFAASSSTYGDLLDLPKVEGKTGKPLSPYAVTKYVNELYADVFAKTYGLELIGLRYFNVFGPKQSSEGAYAAVIPLFIHAVKNRTPAVITGDGEQSRDFTFVENVVQANIKALFTEDENTINQIYNVAYGERTSLNDLWKIISELAGSQLKPAYGEPRLGEVKHSLADLSKAKEYLNYFPLYDLKMGLKKTLADDEDKRPIIYRSDV